MSGGVDGEGNGFDESSSPPPHPVKSAAAATGAQVKNWRRFMDSQSSMHGSIKGFQARGHTAGVGEPPEVLARMPASGSAASQSAFASHHGRTWTSPGSHLLGHGSVGSGVGDLVARDDQFVIPRVSGRVGYRGVLARVVREKPDFPVALVIGGQTRRQVIWAPVDH